MRTVRLRDLAEVNPPTPEFDALEDSTLVTFMPLETVWADKRLDTSRTIRKSEVANGYVRFRDGDVLTPKVTPTFQAGRSAIVGGLSNGAGAATTEVHVIRGRPGLGEGRFLRYRLLAKDFLDEGVASFQGVAGLQRISADFVASRRVPPFGLDEQRRIADFLDDQVARIDAIQRSRSRQRALAAQLLDAEWETLARDVATRGDRVPLRRVLKSIVDGPFGSSLTSSHYVDEGVRVVRLGNIGLNAFRDGDAAFIASDYAVELAAHSLVAGDIVMAGLGDETWPLGRCALVPLGVVPAIVKADCYRIRLVDEVAHDYAACYLSSPPAREEFSSLARGSTRARLNTALAVDVTIPLVDRGTQMQLVDRFIRARAAATSAEFALLRSIDLLHEYKRSLITAAVTGEFDVTTARTGVPA